MPEVRWDRGPDGRRRAWVSTESDRITLRKCADAVQDHFGGEARDRVSGADLVFWDFLVGPLLITLFLEKGVGIAVFASVESAESEALLENVGSVLVGLVGN